MKCTLLVDNNDTILRTTIANKKVNYLYIEYDVSIFAVTTIKHKIKIRSRTIRYLSKFCRLSRINCNIYILICRLRLRYINFLEIFLMVLIMQEIY